ncbi:MAG TPA: hypothetical protein VG206_14280 [Terriglobia bacterium]|nr:hypothetical protein [Terriglobia bacterium]
MSGALASKKKRQYNKLPQQRRKSPVPLTQYLYNSMGVWIAFRQNQYVFNTAGEWIGWLPWREKRFFRARLQPHVVDTNANYLGTIFPGNRFYRLVYAPGYPQPGYPGYPTAPGYPGYPGYAGQAELPLIAEDIPGL